MTRIAEGASLQRAGESLRQKDRTDRCFLESGDFGDKVRRTEGASLR
jgi:hypothetical protein